LDHNAFRSHVAECSQTEHSNHSHSLHADHTDCNCGDHTHGKGEDHHHHTHHHTGHAETPSARKGKTAILLAAFGCALECAQQHFVQFEQLVRSKYPDTDVRWAFTANRIRAKLRQRGYACHSVAEALADMIDSGVRHVAVQSLHTVPGVEYDWTVQQAMGMLHPRKGLTDICIGHPLLHNPQDISRAAQATLDYIPAGLGERDAVVLVGHGTYHIGQAFYLAFESALSRIIPDVIVGTLLGDPGLLSVKERLERMNAKRAILIPFMSVPGHHVKVDIFGNSSHSWLHSLRDNGLEVLPVETGSLTHNGFRSLWLEHLDDAMTRLAAQMRKEGRG